MNIDLRALAGPRSRLVDGTTVDPVTAEVVRGNMETICFEMAEYVSRTATTQILNQSNERNATVLDARGRLAGLDDGTALRAETDAARAAATTAAARLHQAQATLRDHELQLQTTEAKQRKAHGDHAHPQPVQRAQRHHSRRQGTPGRFERRHPAVHADLDAAGPLRPRLPGP